MKDNKNLENILVSAWVISLIATLGSLYFSEIFKIYSLRSLLVSAHFYVSSGGFIRDRCDSQRIRHRSL